MNLFDFYIPEEILVALSLLVLVFVLRRFFWRPVIKIIDNRQKSVDDMLQGAEDAKRIIAEMEEKSARHDAGMEQRIAEKTKEARERATREYDRIIAEAEEKAHTIVEAGEEKARRTYEQSVSEAREAVVMLALGAASAIVESSMDSEKNRELIEAMLQKAGVGHD
jgi:F-type H+-transporting ATPase subunit b